MPTAFRTTAIATDPSGRFRTSIVLASRRFPGHTWSDQAKAEHCARERLPTVALDLTDAEYDRLEAEPALRFGYVDQAGDTTTAFEPTAWRSW